MVEQFLEAFKTPVTNIFDQEAKLNVELEKDSFKDRMFSSFNVSVIIGLSGVSIQGVAVLSMNLDTALQIISKMTEKEDYPELDDLGRDCLGELTNIIVGNGTINLFNMGIKCSSTPPTLVVGNEITLTLRNVEKVGVIPFTLPFGKCELNIAVSSANK